MDRETRLRSCQPMANWGEKCSLGQVKGDLYVDACPCQAGSGKNMFEDMFEDMFEEYV